MFWQENVSALAAHSDLSAKDYTVVIARQLCLCDTSCFILNIGHAADKLCVPMAPWSERDDGKAVIQITDGVFVELTVTFMEWRKGVFGIDGRRIDVGGEELQYRSHRFAVMGHRPPDNLLLIIIFVYAFESNPAVCLQQHVTLPLS